MDLREGGPERVISDYMMPAVREGRLPTHGRGEAEGRRTSLVVASPDLLTTPLGCDHEVAGRGHRRYGRRLSFFRVTIPTGSGPAPYLSLLAAWFGHRRVLSFAVWIGAKKDEVYWIGVAAGTRICAGSWNFRPVGIPVRRSPPNLVLGLFLGSLARPSQTGRERQSSRDSEYDQGR